jgi:hypothetical protein
MPMRASDAMRTARLGLAPVLFALAYLQGCAVDSTQPALSPAGTAKRSDAFTSARSHASPLYLDVWVTAHGTAVGPLLPNMVLHSGDRIGLQARTSSAANVYVIHCDGSRALSVYPASGPISFPAEQRVDLPAVGKDLRLTSSPGDEILYVVASRQRLDESDTWLKEFLSAKHASGAAQVCGGEFEKLLAGPSAPRQQPRARLELARTPPRHALRGVVTRDIYSTMARAFAADDGVIILRFPFRHLP